MTVLMRMPMIVVGMIMIAVRMTMIAVRMARGQWWLAAVALAPMRLG